MPGGVWLHAVSVGEVLAAVPLIRQLRDRYPQLPVFVSTSTVAGRAVAREKLSGIAAGIFWAPIDYGFAISAVLRRIRPAVVVIVETEIWPLLFRRVKQNGCGLVVINGRISMRALPRYRRFSWFFRHALAYPDAILAQSPADAERFLVAGAPAENLSVGGNLKYDAPAPGAPPKAIAALIPGLQPEFVWIAASTMPPARPGDIDEDDVVLAAFRELASAEPRSLLVLVPRKPERFDLTAKKLEDAGLTWLRRSRLGDSTTMALPGVLLVDSIGELASLFPLADVVFLGGTLADRGGHNLLEPAASGRATIIGPHMENFLGVAAEFRAAGAVHPIDHPRELAPALLDLLRHRDRRIELGAKAAALVETGRGAVERAMDVILAERDRALPRTRDRGPAWPLMWLLAQGWRAAAFVSARRKLARKRQLRTPVISIGGITMGGAGKTPFVAFTADLLSRQGLHPAILTRGYRRRSLAREIIVPANGSASPDVSGDEAQILISSLSTVGIGADRWDTGRRIEDRFAPDVFLLDDGFQHRQLARDRDIVLIDALDPFSSGEVFPAGRLREPLSALSRASAFVITRAEPGRCYRGIRAVLAQYNPDAPVYRASVCARGWIDCQKRAAEPLARGTPAVAFCGLGNPASFWRTLADLGVNVRWRWAFDDHHRYKTSEIRRIAARARRCGAGVLLTTEKDLANLPSNALALCGPARILCLRIGTEIEEADAWSSFLRAAVRPVSS